MNQTQHSPTFASRAELRKSVLCALIGIAISTSWSSAQTTYTFNDADNDSLADAGSDLRDGGTRDWTQATYWGSEVVPNPLAGDTIAFDYKHNSATGTNLNLGADRTAGTWS